MIRKKCSRAKKRNFALTISRNRWARSKAQKGDGVSKKSVAHGLGQLVYKKSPHNFRGIKNSFLRVTDGWDSRKGNSRDVHPLHPLYTHQSPPYKKEGGEKTIDSDASEWWSCWRRFFSWKTWIGLFSLWYNNQVKTFIKLHDNNYMERHSVAHNGQWFWNTRCLALEDGNNKAHTSEQSRTVFIRMTCHFFLPFNKTIYIYIPQTLSCLVHALCFIREVKIGDCSCPIFIS